MRSPVRIKETDKQSVLLLSGRYTVM
uniref:Uncharacterized protein n=1 Tax=Anguilla anguilla TaxID=7936 RepID=A0A0E9QYG5_ANGAN